MLSINRTKKRNKPSNKLCGTSLFRSISFCAKRILQNDFYLENDLYSDAHSQVCTNDRSTFSMDLETASVTNAASLNLLHLKLMRNKKCTKCSYRRVEYGFGWQCIVQFGFCLKNIELGQSCCAHGCVLWSKCMAHSSFFILQSVARIYTIQCISWL